MQPTPRKITVVAKLLQRIRAADQTATPTDGPFAKRRPVGTLSPQIMWSPGDAKQGIPPALNEGAMRFYRNLVRLPKASNPKQAQKRTGLLIWGAMVMGLAFPSMRQAHTPDASMRRTYRKIWTELLQSWTIGGYHNLVSVKKNADSFSAKLPIFVGTSSTLHTLREFYKVPSHSGDSRLSDTSPSDLYNLNTDAPGQVAPDLKFELRVGRYTPAQVRPTGGPFDRYIPWLKDTPGCFIEVKRLNAKHSAPAEGVDPDDLSDASQFVVYLCVDFTQQQATVLCQTPWLEIRPLDFYALMLAWSNTRGGTLRGDPPIYSFPMGRIARELPPGGTPRVSDDLSILVDEKSEYWWIEPTKNNIAGFETEYAQHLKRPDGSFSMAPLDPTDQPAPPPKSGLVFVDWVNLKMAFVNGEHKMEVMGLDRAGPANISHYVRILKYPVASELGSNIVSRTFELARAMGLPVTYKGMDGLIKEVLPYFPDLQVDDVTFQDLYNLRNQSPLAQEFVNHSQAILTFANSSVENLYARYAYRTVANLIAYLKILHTFWPKYDEAVALDHQRRATYLEQDKPDPDYQLEAANYISEAGPDGKGGRALMPHQFRNARRLAKSPNFAILAVDAGGGKTASCIYDFLKETTKGNVRRGLIMCPAHLVAQYVKEFLYFTDSRVNVIAVNTYAIRCHTMDGLAEMLMKAPPNTVVVTDYDLAKGGTKNKSFGYGPTPTKVFPLVEMLRSFQFDYVFCDESHYLKGTTGRQSAVARLIADIPYKRLASGTLTPNVITDLVQQVSLLDPTILPRNEMIRRWALEVKGDKIRWKPGYEKEMMAFLKENIVWCQTKRKEWAALLPTLSERQHFVHMTPAQQNVYRTILDEVIETIKKEMKNNKALRRLLTGSEDEEGEAQTEGDNGDDEEEDEDDPSTVDLDRLLRPYLSRLEQFVIAPGADLLGSTMLSGEDLISPKVIKIADVIRDHIANDTPGKILIFTNNVASAEAIHEFMPPDIKSRMILYTAGNKEADAAHFERDPNMIAMVGVETSMNTGLNLQFCSRLIRADTVWTPGALEQGNSRVQRPNVKNKETRTEVYLDWIACENSIDIAKRAYLLQKQVAIGKFEEAGNPEFDAIELPKPFKLSLDVIRRSETQEQDELVEYFGAYSKLFYATTREWKRWRAEHPEDCQVDPATGAITMTMTQLERAPNQPGAALMYRVPYVPGTELYKAEHLGLVRYDAYMHLNEQDLEDEDEGQEDASQRAASRAELEKVRGLPVHTEYGDGIIIGVSRKFLRVQLPSGDTVRVGKLSAFVITRAQTNNKDQRELLLRQIGDLPYDKPFEIEVKEAREVRIPKKNQTKEDDRVSVALYIRVSNDIVGLEMNNAKANPRAAAALEAFGFIQPRPYFFAEMPTAEHMYRQFKLWAEAGFYFDKESSEACKRMYQSLKTARKNAASFVGHATAADVRNFYMRQTKADPDKKKLYPYPLIEDDVLYLALPMTGHPASAAAIRAKRAPGVTWQAMDDDEVADLRVVYMRSLEALDRNIPKLLEQGLIITNIKDLITRRRKLQRRHGDILTHNK